MLRPTMMASCGRSTSARTMVVAHEFADQPVGEIVQIVKTFAQVRVGLAQHARPCVALHLFDRGLCGEAVPDRLLDLVGSSPGRRRTSGRLRAPRDVHP